MRRFYARLLREPLLYLSMLLFMLTGCAAAREAVAAAVGAFLYGPAGAAVGGFVAHTVGAVSDGGASTEAAVCALGFFARVGHRIDQLVAWVAVGAVVALFVFPRWRALAFAFLTGLPRAVLALVRRDAPAAQAAAGDVLLAAPRIVGAVRESSRTRPKANVVTANPDRTDP